MREIKELIIHCADTKTNQNFDVSDVRKWHVDERGWSDCGYHYFIKLNGKLQLGRPIEKSGAHCKGNNQFTIGICFEGGKTPSGESWNAPTPNQFNTFKDLKTYLFMLFGDIKISGHYEYSSKTCPNFNVEILK